MCYHVPQWFSKPLLMTNLYAVFVSLLTMNVSLHHQQYWKLRMRFYLQICLPNGSCYVTIKQTDQYLLTLLFFVVVNKNDLCTCGISAQHIFLYESMHIVLLPMHQGLCITYTTGHSLLMAPLCAKRTTMLNNIT